MCKQTYRCRCTWSFFPLYAWKEEECRTYAANLQTRTRKRTERGLRTGTRRLCLAATSSPQLDVECSEAKTLCLLGSVLRGKHSRVRRRLVAISLHLHAASDTRNCLLAGQVRDVHKGIIERRINVRHAKHLFAFASLRAAVRLYDGRSPPPSHTHTHERTTTRVSTQCTKRVQTAIVHMTRPLTLSSTLHNVHSFTTRTQYTYDGRTLISSTGGAAAIVILPPPPLTVSRSNRSPHQLKTLEP